jgi:hypothetical protein
LLRSLNNSKVLFLLLAVSNSINAVNPKGIMKWLFPLNTPLKLELGGESFPVKYTYPTKDVKYTAYYKSFVLLIDLTLLLNYWFGMIF